MCLERISLEAVTDHWPGKMSLLTLVQAKSSPTVDCETVTDADLGVLIYLLWIPQISNPHANVSNGVPSRDLTRYPSHPGCSKSPFSACVGGQLAPATSIAWQLSGSGAPFHGTFLGATIRMTFSGYMEGPRGERPTTYQERSRTPRWPNPT